MVHGDLRQVNSVSRRVMVRMSKFIESCSCRMGKPLDGMAQGHVMRSELTARLLQERMVARFVVAPEGFGKSMLAYQYAQLVFAFKGVFWVRCESPCFIRDLDEGDLARQILKFDEDASLVVFDDVPDLNSDRKEKLEQCILQLLDAGCEVICMLVPSLDWSMSSRCQIDRIVASELLLSDSEMESEKMRGNSSASLGSRTPKGARVAALVWGDWDARQLLAPVSKELLPADVLLAMFSILCLGSGFAADLSCVCPAPFLEESMAFLSDGYPFLGIEDDRKRFCAIDVSIADVSLAFASRLPWIAKASSSEDAQGLALALADRLLADSKAERACDIAKSLMDKPEAGSWIAREGWRMLERMDAKPVLDLCEFSRKGSADVISIDCLASWAAYELDDMDRARRVARRVLSRADSLEASAPAALMAWMIGISANKEPANLDIHAHLRALSTSVSSAGQAQAFDFDLDSALRIAASWDKGITACLDAWNDLFSPERMRDDAARKAALMMAPSVLESCIRRQRSDADAEEGCHEPDPSFEILCSAICASCSEALDCMEGSMIWGEYVAAKALSKAAEAFPGMVPKLGFHIEAEAIACERHLERQVAAIRQEDLEREVAKAAYRKTHPNPFRKDGPTELLIDIEPPTLYVSLFGGLEVFLGEEPVDRRLLNRRKAKLLLAILVISKGKSMSRDRLVRLLWPECDESKGRRNLYTITSQVKRALSVDGRCPYIISTPNMCKLDSRYVASDFYGFEGFCRNLIFGADEDIAWDEAFARVSEDYAGELLPEQTSCEYIDSIRAKCTSDLVDALISASSRLISLGDLQGALWFSREAMERDPRREDVYVSMMSAQMAAGQRGPALDTYFECLAFLKDDLGIDPSSALVDLYNKIIGIA